MGGVGGARREIDEERFVWHQRFLLSYPGDRPVGQILCQRVTLLRCLWRFDGRGAFVEAGIVLIRFAADEPIEMFEARTRRPLMEGTDGRYLPAGDLVAFAELRRRVAIQLQDLG